MRRCRGNETIAFALQQDYRSPPVLDGV